MSDMKTVGKPALEAPKPDIEMGMAAAPAQTSMEGEHKTPENGQPAPSCLCKWCFPCCAIYRYHGKCCSKDMALFCVSGGVYLCCWNPK